MKCQECGSEDEVETVSFDMDLPSLTLCYVCRYLVAHPELKQKIDVKKNGSGRLKRPDPS